jgi:hypothetical protein
MKVVAVGVVDAGKYLTYHQAFETSFDCLHLFYPIGLQTNRCKSSRYLFGCHVEIDIFL